jgi:hypothetical protein
LPIPDTWSEDVIPVDDSTSTVGAIFCKDGGSMVGVGVGDAVGVGVLVGVGVGVVVGVSVAVGVDVIVGVIEVDD